MSTRFANVINCTVALGGTIPVVLPESLRGKTVAIVTEETMKPLHGHPKTLEEIVAEQGGPRICTDPDDLSRDFPKIWDTEEEIEVFLRRRKEEL